MTHTHKHTLGSTSLDEGSARRTGHLRDKRQHSKQTSKPPEGFQPAIPASARPQTYTVDSAAIGTGKTKYWGKKTVPVTLSPKWTVPGPNLDL